MVAMRRILLVALALTIAGACLAQGWPPAGGQGGPGGPGGGRGGFGGRGGMFMGGSLIQSVLEDITILNQLVALQLTLQQLEGIIDTYSKFPLSTDERVTKLMEMRTRLVGGLPLTPEDGEVIRGMFQRQQGDQPQAPANPLAEAIWKQLTPVQQSALLGSGGFGFGGPGQQWSRERTLDLLGRLNQAMETYQEAEWPAKKDALADAMACTVPEPQRANAKAMFADFLERMWQMPGADFEGKKNELATNLEGIVPQGASLAPALALLNPQAITRAMDRTFLNAKSLSLLKEFQAARAAKAGK